MRPETAPSRRRQTALTLADAFNKWSLEAIMATHAEDYIHHVLPKSLGRKAMDNTAYEKYMKAVMPHFKNYTVTINDIIEDAQENKVAVWLYTSASTEIGLYNDEACAPFHPLAKKKK
ncbi:hypothetical protein F5Y12DRAFT_755851 [Xylaria sp. FL1777]|nr:hypothetical protein F5Y12DRAFT_755851 [Xylaria sp. FL1777]